MVKYRKNQLITLLATTVNEGMAWWLADIFEQVSTGDDFLEVLCRAINEYINLFW